MRLSLHSAALAGVLAMGGMTGLGTTTAHAQNYVGYYPVAAYSGYPGGAFYGQGCRGAACGRAYVTGYAVPQYSGYYRGYSCGSGGCGYRGYGYGYGHHRHHHRGCGRCGY
jgi:hypothetical protein